MDCVQGPAGGSPQGDAEVDISVVIPCLDEVRTVGQCVAAALEGIAATGLCGEVIVADNGSSDGSREAAAAAGARVVPVMRRGYGAALQEGFLAARGRLLVMGDADASYDFRELADLVDQQRRTGADLVLGDRRGRIEPGAMPWTHRWIGNPLISFAITRLFRVQLNDCYCGLRLLTRESYQRMRLNASSMEYALEMIVQGALVGLRFSQVPVTLRVDGRDRPPHLHTVRDGYRSLRFLFQHAPITAYGIAGGLAVAAGLALLGHAAWLETHGGTPAAATAAVGGALLLSGWLLAVLGVIARVFVTGFLCGQTDLPLQGLFRVARLETAMLASAVMLATGLWMVAGLNRWAALLELGLTLCITAIGTFVGAFVVSLIGRAIPSHEPDVPARTDHRRLARPAGAESSTSGGRSLASEEAMAHASNYHAWIADHLRGAWDGAGRVLDVGCSIGNVTQAIVDAVADQQTLVVGLETRPDAGRRFAERFASRDNVRLASFDITAPASELDALGPFDAAVSVGLLEHIDDDVAALRAVAARLKPGGRLGLLVPGGGDRLYGTLDALDGHFRRYTTPRLSARLRAAGFEVVTIRPVSMAGAVAWFLKGRVLRSRRLSAGEVRVLDRAIPVVRRIDAVLGPPFGQSLVAIARLP